MMMYKATKTILVKDATINVLWDAHSDVANWSKWQEHIEWIKVSGEVKAGTSFEMKPKGGKAVKLAILNFDKPYLFKDVSHLPLADMEVATYMEEVPDGVSVKLEIKMTGLLTFLWKNVVAKKIITGHEAQYKAMVSYIKAKN